jgi:Flp pilus assembly CpaE family ATPase
MGARHLTLSSDQRQHVTLEGLVRIFQLSQAVFDFVIVDLGFVSAAEWSRVMQCADALLLVSEPSELALAMLEGYLKAVDSAGIDRSRFQIVVNRARQNDEAMISKYEGILRQNVFAQLANDFRRVSEAVSLGVPLTISSSNPLVPSYREMASRLVNPPKQNSSPSRDVAVVSLSHA